MQGLIYSWIHDADPIDSLQATKYLERFNQEIKQNPRLLQDLIEKHFLVRIQKPRTDLFGKSNDSSRKTNIN